MNSNHWQQIKAIFNEAIALEEPERTDFLRASCAEDPPLMQEVRSLLHSYEASGDFLDDPGADIGLLQDAANDPYLGQQVESFKIQSLIAEGGMGRVYLAERTDGGFAQKVAIKLVRHSLNTNYLLQRFHNERQTLSNLQHPYIAQLLGGGTTGEGVPYFIMEHVEGIPVDEYCDQQRLSIQQRLDLFQKICSAVHYVHTNLVVHRDIKPSNILVTADGIPKLLDFGIAKILEEGDNATNRITNTNQWNLTPDYASPEQLQGQQITTATDVYALGVILYNLLSGRHPYQLKNASPASIIQEVCEVPHPKMSTIAAQQEGFKPANKEVSTFQAIAEARQLSGERLPKKLQGDLDTIVLKAMHRDAGRRYGSVEQFSEDIRRYSTGLPVLARKDTVGYRMGKFMRRHRIAVAASILVLITLIAGIVGISWQARLAAAERDKAQTEARKAERINTFLQEMLSSADPGKEGKDVKVVEVIDQAAATLGEELPDELATQASLRTTLGSTYESLGIYDKAVEQFQLALATRESLFGVNDPQTIQSVKNLALAYHYQGDYGKAGELYAQASSKFQALGDTTGKHFAELLNDYGTLFMDLGEYEKSLDNFHRALVLYKQVHGPEHRQVAAVLNNMAMAYHYVNDLEKAERYYKEAIAMDKKLLGDESIELTRLINNLAFVFLERKEYQEAIDWFQESREMRRKIQGPEHPDFALATYNVGCTYYYVEKYEKGMGLIDSAMAIWDNTLAPDHPLYGNAYYWKGKMKNVQGEPQKALEFLSKSLVIRMKEGNRNDFLLSRTRCEMGRSYLLAKNYLKARNLLEENFPILKEEAGEESMHVKEVAETMHALYTQLKRPSLAAQYQ